MTHAPRAIDAGPQNADSRIYIQRRCLSPLPLRLHLVVTPTTLLHLQLGVVYDQTCATYVAAFQTCATYPRLLCHFAFPAMAPLPSNTCVPSQLEARERVHVHETTQFVRSVDSARCTSLIFRAIFPIRTMQHPMVFFDAVYCIFGTIGMIFNLFGTR
jgi:hypothetical protein